MKQFGLLLAQFIWVIAFAAIICNALTSLGIRQNAKLVKLAAVFICLGVFVDMIQWIVNGAHRIGDKFGKVIDLLFG